MAARSRLAALSTVVVVLSGACGSDTADVGSPTTAGVEGRGWQECSAPDEGFRLRFPPDWHTAAADGGGPCRFFHPEPFDVPANTDATAIAVSVRRSNAPFDRIVPGDGSPAVEVRSRQPTTVANRSAVRLETTSTGEALLPSGVRGVTYYVDFGADTLVASTLDVASAGTFDDNVAVLDEMMTTVVALDSPESACSAATLSTDLRLQSQLPAAAAVTREAIVEAAVGCDYQALADLGDAGTQPFTYSFGDDGRPAAFWQQQEADGVPVLRFLVEMLRRPVASREVTATTQYVWPSAYAYESWAEVPRADREALRPVYGDEALGRFAQFGSYLGYRVAISASGEWLFFVGGD